MYSHIDNITLTASVSVSKSELRDVALLNIGEEPHIVTCDILGEVQVFSSTKQEVIEKFTPEGETTVIRVFEQHKSILFVAVSKQAPGGSIVSSL